MIPFDYKKQFVPILTKQDGRIRRHKLNVINGVIHHPDFGYWMAKYGPNFEFKPDSYTRQHSSQLGVDSEGRVLLGVYNSSWFPKKLHAMVHKQMDSPAWREAFMLFNSEEFLERHRNDRRFRVGLEWAGAPEQKHILRFCDDFVACMPSEQMARDLALRLAVAHQLLFRGLSRANNKQLKYLCLK